jgi:hypothetical protein
MRSLFARTIVLIACVAGASSPGQIFAKDESLKLELARQTTTFGTLGIIAGQTLRLGAVRQPGDDQDVTVCNVDLNIFDIHGNQRASVSKHLDPGKGAFLDLARTDFGPPLTEARLQVYAIADVTSTSRGGKPSCHVAPSIEIFDQADGRSRIYQGSVEVRDSELRNVAPPGSQAQCFGSCSLETASCPAPFDCWANPISGEFKCCNGRP